MTGKKKKRTWTRGVNVTSSKEAHATMLKKANESVPRMNLREYLNVIHGLPKEL